MEGEIWKVIPGFSNYMASNKGRIKNIKTGYITLGSLDDAKYRRFTLYNDDGVKIHTKVHILVAKAFLPNPDNLPEVNHKNKNHEDNRVENLEWVSHKKNMQHFFKEEGIKHNNARPIKCVETGEIFPSLRKAAEAKHVNKERIRVSANDKEGKRKSAGYHWKWIDGGKQS